MRALLFGLCLSFTVISPTVAANTAHPEPEKPAAKKPLPKLPDLPELPELPSQDDIQDALKDMPDINAVMGDILKVVQDPEFRSTMESVGDKMAARVEGMDFGAMRSQSEGGMPDFNAVIGELMSIVGDEEIMGEMLGTAIVMKEMAEKRMPKAESILSPKE